MNNDFERMNQPPQPPNHPRPSIAIAMGDDEEDWEAVRRALPLDLCAMQMLCWVRADA